MTNETRETLREVLGVTQTSQVTPQMVQRLHTAARELLTEPAAHSTTGTSGAGGSVRTVHVTKKG